MTDTNILLDVQTWIMLISIFLLLIGIEKKDSIIGFICCYASGFILLAGYIGSMIPSINGLIILIVIFVAMAIGTYKVFLFTSEKENRG